MEKITAPVILYNGLNDVLAAPNVNASSLICCVYKRRYSVIFLILRKIQSSTSYHLF